MMLDVFLTSFEEGEEVPVEPESLDFALAANGVTGDRATVRTTDGGTADLMVDTDGASFMIERLTPELSRVVFDIARDARLVVLPADGTPSAYLVDRRLAAGLPEDLEPSVVTTSSALHDALSASSEARGAHPA